MGTRNWLDLWHFGFCPNCLSETEGLYTPLINFAYPYRFSLDFSAEQNPVFFPQLVRCRLIFLSLGALMDSPTYLGTYLWCTFFEVASTTSITCPPSHAFGCMRKDVRSTKRLTVWIEVVTQLLTVQAPSGHLTDTQLTLAATVLPQFHKVHGFFDLVALCSL